MTSPGILDTDERDLPTDAITTATQTGRVAGSITPENFQRSLTVAAIDEYEDGLVEDVRTLAPTLEEKLRRLEKTHDSVGSIHGRGFHCAVEFTDPETGEPFLHPWHEERKNPVKGVREVAYNNGVLCGSGRPDIQVIVSPPFCVDKTRITEAVNVLDEAITTAFA